MGIYVVTGASSGIGAETAKIIREAGNEVVNIDVKDGDIDANLATPEGRQACIDEVHKRYPDGLDGVVCNAGVSGGRVPNTLILQLNYFGAVAIAEGLFDLLEKKGGACVVTASNTIAQGNIPMDVVDMLTNVGDEQRICELYKDTDPVTMGHMFYTATKFALARWMRRTSAEWAARGVRLNAIAPGNVRTAMTAGLSPEQRAAMEAIPVPTHYGEEPLMDPEEIGNVTAFLLSKKASGINGVVIFADGGTDALTHPGKVF